MSQVERLEYLRVVSSTGGRSDAVTVPIFRGEGAKLKGEDLDLAVKD